MYITVVELLIKHFCLKYFVTKQPYSDLTDAQHVTLTEKKTAPGQLEHGFCHLSQPDSQAKM